MSACVLVGLCIAFAVWVGLFITLAATQHKEHNEKYDEKDKRPNDRFDHAHISPAEDCSSSEAEYKDGLKASENFERAGQGSKLVANFAAAFPDVAKTLVNGAP